MRPKEHPYEVWVIDPNDTGAMIGEAFTQDSARKLRELAKDYENAGCRVEIWRDGKPIDSPEDLGPEDYEYVDLNDLPL